jgi:hypothetical protein
MGALDGITYSNSFYFNGALDWKGVLIEANPNNYKKLVLNRQFELVTPIHAAVCDKEKDVHWVSRNAGNGATGGIFEFAPKEFQEKWWSKKLIDNALVIKCLPLSTIILNTTARTNGHAFFDFFSLGVEGAEYEVLKSIDFDAISFGVIFYESDQHNPLKNVITRSFLESQGYPFLVDYQESQWHVNANFANLYSNIVRDG